MPVHRADTLRLIAVLLGVLACLPSYGCGLEPSGPPRIVAPSRPQALHAEPAPPSLHDALEALDHGLSGRDFRAMQLLAEEDAVASTYAVARWVQQAWLQPHDSALRTALASAGFDDYVDMSDAILRSFWRRLHDRPLDLDGQAREARARQRGALRSPRAAVFPESSAAGLVEQCSRPLLGPVTGVWTPDVETIQRLEEALGPALQEALDRQPPIAGWTWNAAEYYRQYGGLLVNGRRIVYINGFHQRYHAMVSDFAQPTLWRRSAVNVCDGGRDFFGAVYDPNTGRIESLAFN